MKLAPTTQIAAITTPATKKPTTPPPTKKPKPTISIIKTGAVVAAILLLLALVFIGIMLLFFVDGALFPANPGRRIYLAPHSPLTDISPEEYSEYKLALDIQAIEPGTTNRFRGADYMTIGDLNQAMCALSVEFRTVPRLKGFSPEFYENKYITMGTALTGLKFFGKVSPPKGAKEGDPVTRAQLTKMVVLIIEEGNKIK